MMLCPLYLNGENGLHVRPDGPSLLVSQSGRASGRYPFRRLSRVVSDTRVVWTTGAVVECLKHGVPVFFNTPGGDLIGSCYGTRKREATLGNLLQLAMDRPEWGGDFDNWYSFMEVAEARSCVKEIAIRAREYRPEVVYTKAVSHLYKKWQLPPAKYLKAYSGLLRPWIEQQLLDNLGGDGSAIAFPVAGCHFGEQFTALSRWHMVTLLATDSCSVPEVNELPLVWAVRCFESHLPDHGRSLGRYLGRFESWLRDIVS